MDATRARRTRDRARQGWYACYRQWRFARYLGFADGPEAVLAALSACRPGLADGRPGPGPIRKTGSLGRQPASPAPHRNARPLALAAR
jgi:hypothetical protein